MMALNSNDRKVAEAMFERYEQNFLHINRSEALKMLRVAMIKLMCVCESSGINVTDICDPEYMSENDCIAPEWYSEMHSDVCETVMVHAGVLNDLARRLEEDEVLNDLIQKFEEGKDNE